MKKKVLIPIISVVVVLAIAVPIVLSAIGIGKAKKDAIVIMTEELSGLFNPFYATSGTDQDVVGMTQIGMLSTKRINNETKIVAGDEYPVVVKDYGIKIAPGDTETEYTFVLKKGLKFADGKPLTMNDVMFNLYEYLDPVYTGSSTMYSIKIKGLTKYRTQSDVADGSEDNDNTAASEQAFARILTLYNLAVQTNIKNGNESSFEVSEAEMKDAINNADLDRNYGSAFLTEKEMDEYDKQGKLLEVLRKKMIADYEMVCTEVKKGLDEDYKAAQTAFDLNDAKYTNTRKSDIENLKNSEIFRFFVYEGKIVPVYNKGSDNKDNYDDIKEYRDDVTFTKYTTKEAAINRIYKETVENNLNSVLSYGAVYNTISTQFIADARTVILKDKKVDGKLLYPSIEGIVSLGHTKGYENVNEVEFKSEVSGETKKYNVAHSHNADGTVKNEDEFDVLRITIENVDPKAIYNFSFTVAPAHYYTAASLGDEGAAIDIANNKFGVEHGEATFQTTVIQSQKNNSVPMGAGVYVATDKNNGDNPSASGFYDGSIVYFKSNKNFEFASQAKHEKMRMLVVSSTNAIDKLRQGEVDYITPQYKTGTAEEIDKISGAVRLQAKQLGYGYIGINAGIVKNINVRRAIMSAMDTSLALTFYTTGTCDQIFWPMSNVSDAYPKDKPANSAYIGSSGFSIDSDVVNENSYITFDGDAAAEKKIKYYTQKAIEEDGVTQDQLKITFTIAGSSITEHPTFMVFNHAMELLNKYSDLGWKIEVKADTRALTKLSRGALSVWAAAWGSTIDPDMYQVYHINSTATSVNAWGYPQIKAAPSEYVKETAIISELSTLIEEGRETLDMTQRKPTYEKAMLKVLELAVEMPVYQRSNLFAYNSKTVKGFPDKVDEYTSPLEKIWLLEQVK